MDTLRQAAPDDAPDIALTEASSGPWSEEAVQRLLRQPHIIAWVVGDPVVGHLLASQVGDEGEVLTLAVRVDARRRGFARAMLVALERRWRATRVQTGWLEVRADNVGARALYTSLGWSDAGRRPGYYADGTDAIVMRWVP